MPLLPVPELTAGYSIVQNHGAALTKRQILNASTGLVSVDNAGASRTDITVDQGFSPTWSGNHVFSNNVTSAPAPTSPSHLANKSYVDSLSQGLIVKQPALAKSTANVASLSGTITVDGISLVAGNRILLTNQTTGSQNGIWVVAAGAWTRATDFAAGSSAAGAFFFVEEGAVFADTAWVCTSDPGSDVVGTNSLAFSQFAGPGSYSAGAGLSLTGTVFSMPNVGPGAGTIGGSANYIDSLTLDAQGRVTAVATLALSLQAVYNAVSSGVQSIQLASDAVNNRSVRILDGSPNNQTNEIFSVVNGGNSLSYLQVIGTPWSNFPGLRVYQHINAWNLNTLNIGSDATQTSGVNIGHASPAVNTTVLGAFTVQGSTTVQGSIVPNAANTLSSGSAGLPWLASWSQYVYSQWTGITSTTTTAEGITAINNSAATVGVQQYSPIIALQGSGWGGSAQPVKFGLQAIPVQGGGAPTGQLSIFSSINNGAYGSALWTLDTSGNVTASGSVFSSGVDRSNAGTFTVGGTNATMVQVGGTATTSIPFQISGSTKWTVDSSGNLVAAAAQTVDSDGGTVKAATLDVSSAGTLIVGGATATQVSLQTSNTLRWFVSSGGTFSPGTDVANNIGSNLFRANSGYFATLRSGDTAAVDTTGSTLTILGQVGGSASAVGAGAGGPVNVSGGIGGFSDGAHAAGAGGVGQAFGGVGGAGSGAIAGASGGIGRIGGGIGGAGGTSAAGGSGGATTATGGAGGADNGGGGGTGGAATITSGAGANAASTTSSAGGAGATTVSTGAGGNGANGANGTAGVAGSQGGANASLTLSTGNSGTSGNGGTGTSGAGGGGATGRITGSISFNVGVAGAGGNGGATSGGGAGGLGAAGGAAGSYSFAGGGSSRGGAGGNGGNTTAGGTAGAGGAGGSGGQFIVGGGAAAANGAVGGIGGTASGGGTNGAGGTGGAGLDLSFQAGTGGLGGANGGASATSGTGGRGGNFTVTAGTGALGGTAGSGTAGAGGAAGTISITGGTGAAAQTVTATAGGTVQLIGGVGGASDGTGAAGAGAQASVLGGAGGAGSSAIVGAVGGLLNLRGGAGGVGTATGAGGAGGAAQVLGGAAGTNNGASSGLGGAAQLIGGAGAAASGANAGTAGGASTVQGGTGGAATSTGAAGVGALATFAGGTAGAGSGTTAGGAGGAAQANGGTGGAGSATGVAGIGGSMLVLGGNAGTNGGGGGANAGSVFIRGGLGSGAGTNGTVNIGDTNTSSINIGAVGINVFFPGGVLRASTQATNVAGIAMEFGRGNGGAAGGGAAAGIGGASTFMSGGGGGATTTASETAGTGGATIVQGGIGGTGAASVNAPGNGGSITVAGGAAGAQTSGFGNANGGNANFRGGAKIGSGTNGTVNVGDSNTAAVNVGAAAIYTNIVGPGNVASQAAPGSPANGDFWTDSTQKTLAVRQDGITQQLQGTIFTATATGTVANTTAETSAIGTGVGTKTLPAAFFVAGKTVRIKGGGIYSTQVTPGNITIKIKYGTTVLATATISALISGASNNAFQFEAAITCRTTGATGTVMTDASLDYDATTNRGFAALNNAGATTTIDTTTSNALDVTVTWATGSASNTISTTVTTIEVLN